MSFILLSFVAAFPLIQLSQLLHSSDGSITVEKDHQYGPHPNHRLDVYCAEELFDAPILIMIHGGGFHGGDKRTLRRLAAFFIECGFVIVAPNYRFAPEFTFPSQVEDIACAVAWIQDRAKDYNADRSRLAFFGNSAGAYLGAMVAYDRDGDYCASCYSVGSGFDVIGFIGFAGEYDFDLLDGNSNAERALLGDLFDPDLWGIAEPINYVSPHSSPALLIVGSEDTVVNPQNSIDLASVLYENHVYASLHVIQGYGHMGPLLNFYSNPEVQVSVDWFVAGILCQD